MNFLNYIDITKNEEIVYKGFLQHPDTNASKLARILRLDKSSTYRAVDGLLAKGLIIQSTNHDEEVYRSVSPKRLAELHKAKSQELHDKKDDLNSYINELVKLASQYDRGTKFKVEYGFTAHLEVMERSLELGRGEIIYEKWYESNPIFKDIEYSNYINKFIQRRLKKDIHIQYLVNSTYDTSRSKINISSLELKKEVRRNPADADDKNSFRIFGNEIEIISFDKNNDFIVITIEDPFVSQMFKKFFQFIWARSDKI